MTHDRQAYLIKPGTVLLFDKGELHDKRCAPYQKSFRHLWLHLPSRHALVSNLWQLDAKRKGHNTELKFSSDRIAPLVSDLWTLCATKHDIRFEWAFLKATIAYLLLESASDRSQVETPSSQHQVIESVCEYIKNNLEKELTLSRLAKLSGYSPYFFHRMFRHYKKKAVHQYVVNARIEKAKQLLKDGHSVSSVIDQVGIEPPTYFSRWFRKNSGFNPSKWREMHLAAKTNLLRSSDDLN